MQTTQNSTVYKHTYISSYHHQKTNLNRVQLAYAHKLTAGQQETAQMIPSKTVKLDAYILSLTIFVKLKFTVFLLNYLT